MKAEVRAFDSAETVRLVVETLQAQITRILCLSAAKAGPDRSVTDLGVDSLMDMELDMTTEECFEVKLPAVMLAEGVTVRSLMQKIAESVRAGATDGQEVGAASDVEQQLASLSAIHDSEIGNDELQHMACEIVANRAIADVFTETTL